MKMGVGSVPATPSGLPRGASSTQGSAFRLHPGLNSRRRFAARDWLRFFRLAALIASAILLSGFLASIASAQQAQLLVTVFDEKTGNPIENLDAGNFSVIDDNTPLRVVGAEYKKTLLDVMLLVDTSALGEVVRPLSAAFVEGLGQDEQMAIVGFHDSADLLQDFTNSKQTLMGALRGVRFGNNPRILDALFAGLDGGFAASSAARRVIVLLAAGVEGRSKVPLADVLRLAKDKRASIYPVYVEGVERGLFRRLARRTGGAHFRARLRKQSPKDLAKIVYVVLRGHYVLELTGVYTLGDRMEIKIQGLPKSDVKPWASALPLD